MSATLSVLLVDDSADDREFIARTLKGLECRILESECGEEALATLRTASVDCTLLDFSLPGENGLTILRELKLRYPEMAIVMLTGEGSERIAVEALKAGAQDYLLKGDVTRESLATAMDGALSRKKQEAEIVRQANYDDLTGLANRRMFIGRLERAIGRADLDTAFAVILFDLDGFKTVNDTHGHEGGDALLKEVARRAAFGLRRSDIVARLGGDEFILLLEDLQGDGVKGADLVAHRLVERVQETPYFIGGKQVSIGVSLGVALCPSMADNRFDLLRIADKRMYEDKHRRQDDFLQRA
jgi:diguanylate cyclase (GGDEF)-like protein